MNYRKITSFLLVVLLLTTVSSASISALSFQAKFKSCSTLRRVWPYGVAVSATKAKKQPVRPKVNAAVYQQNRRLDTDNDGTVCELKVVVQNQPPFTYPAPIPVATFTTSTTMTTTTTTTIPVRPAGTWKMRWMGVAGDSPKDETGKSPGGPGVNVVYGEQAEIIICESAGDLPAKLEVKENGNWKVVASGFKSVSDPTRCASPDRPIGFSFYWMVNISGTTKYRSSGAAYYSRDLQIQMTTSSRSVAFSRLESTRENSGLEDGYVSLSCALSGKTNC